MLDHIERHKMIRRIFIAFVILIILTTLFGPWKTYHLTAHEYHPGKVTTYSQEYPTWFGSFAGFFVKIEPKEPCNNPVNPFD